MENMKEEQDIMSAESIVSEIEKLIASEKSEGEPDEAADIRELEEAITHLKAFITNEAEEAEKPPTEDQFSDAFVDKVIARSKGNTVDTDVLTGPIGGLKNFLIKKQRSNEAK